MDHPMVRFPTACLYDLRLHDCVRQYEQATTARARDAWLVWAEEAQTQRARHLAEDACTLHTVLTFPTQPPLRDRLMAAKWVCQCCHRSCTRDEIWINPHPTNALGELHLACHDCLETAVWLTDQADAIDVALGKAPAPLPEAYADDDFADDFPAPQAAPEDDGWPYPPPRR